MVVFNRNLISTEVADDYVEYVPVAKRRAIEAQKILQRKRKFSALNDHQHELENKSKSKPPSLLMKVSQLKREAASKNISLTEQLVQEEKEMIEP